MMRNLGNWKLGKEGIPWHESGSHHPACRTRTSFWACPEACNPCAEAIMDATAWKETNGRKNACFFDKGDKGRGMSEPITSSPDRNWEGEGGLFGAREILPFSFVSVSVCSQNNNASSKKDSPVLCKVSKVRDRGAKKGFQMADQHNILQIGEEKA